MKAKCQHISDRTQRQCRNNSIVEDGKDLSYCHVHDPNKKLDENLGIFVPFDTQLTSSIDKKKEKKTKKEKKEAETLPQIPMKFDTIPDNKIESMGVVANIEDNDPTIISSLLEGPFKISIKDDGTIIDKAGSPIDQRVIDVMMLSKQMPAQRTPEWLRMRYEMLTASDIGASLVVTDYELQLYESGIIDIPPANRKIGKGCYPYKPIKQYLREKCVAYGEQQPFTGNMYTWHGTKYEDAAAIVYEYKNNQVVHDFGLIRHPIYSFLGASPDGITSSGRMLEIKVPLSRKLCGIPPIHYWIQMQLQMECCDFDVCDFVECKITEYDCEDQYLNDTFVDEEGNTIYGLTKEGMHKGCMLCVEYVDGDNTRKQMIYSPLAIEMKNHQDMIEWTKKELLRLAQGNNGDNLIEIILQEGCMSVERFWWKIDQYSQVEVARDPEWFSKRLFDFEEFWKNVEKYRKEGIPESCMPKKRNGQLVDDDEDDTMLSAKKTQSTLSFKSTNANALSLTKPSSTNSISKLTATQSNKTPLRKGEMGFCIVDDDEDF